MPFQWTCGALFATQVLPFSNGFSASEATIFDVPLETNHVEVEFNPICICRGTKLSARVHVLLPMLVPARVHVRRNMQFPETMFHFHVSSRNEIDIHEYISQKHENSSYGCCLARWEALARPCSLMRLIHGADVLPDDSVSGQSTFLHCFLNALLSLIWYTL